MQTRRAAAKEDAEAAKAEADDRVEQVEEEEEEKMKEEKQQQQQQQEDEEEEEEEEEPKAEADEEYQESEDQEEDDDKEEDEKQQQPPPKQPTKKRAATSAATAATTPAKASTVGKATKAKAKPKPKAAEKEKPPRKKVKVSKAEETAKSINQEQLVHELEQKFLQAKDDLTLSEAERETLQAQKKAVVDENLKLKSLLEAKEAECEQQQQQMGRLESENDHLTVELKNVKAQVQRRVDEIETLRRELKEASRKIVDAQQKELDAIEEIAAKETQLEPLNQTVSRLDKELSNAKTYTEWLEKQVQEKTKSVQELRQTLSKRTHEYEEEKMKWQEDSASLQRLLQTAKTSADKLDRALVSEKERVKESQALRIQQQDQFQKELQAQQRLAELYKEASEEAHARVGELQEICGALREKIVHLENELTAETERQDERVQRLFQEQVDRSEKQMEELQQELLEAQARIKELESKKTSFLQNASALADLSNSAADVHLAKHGLSAKDLYDNIVELESELQEERQEKAKLQLYLDRIVKEVQEKAPVIMGLRHDHEQAVQSHTQLSEKLEACMQDLIKSREQETKAWKAKQAMQLKCESLAQSVDDLSRQVQHLLFRKDNDVASNDLDVMGDASENLVVFKNIEELQKRNQQLLSIIRDLTRKLRRRKPAGGVVEDDVQEVAIGSENADAPHWIVAVEDSDDESIEYGAGVSNEMQERLAIARKEIQSLRAERDQEREMIAAIVKQRDMYRVLLAQADNKFLEDNNSESEDTTGRGAKDSQQTTSPSRDPVPSTPRSPRALLRSSFESQESRNKLRELQVEFDDYKKEKQQTQRMLQDSIDTLRSETSAAKLSAMQAEVDAKCHKERLEVCEARLKQAEDENSRLVSKSHQLSSLLLQHQKLLTDAEAKYDTLQSEFQKISIEKQSLDQTSSILKKQEQQSSAEMARLRLDNTNLLKLMDSQRRTEALREEREAKDKEALQQRVVTLENQAQDLVKQLDSRQLSHETKVMELENAQAKLTKTNETLKEQLSELKASSLVLTEKNKSLEEKIAAQEKEIGNYRTVLKKGANAAAAERVAALEMQLKEAKQELQGALDVKKSLTENAARYKAIAEANEQALEELSKANERWKQERASKEEADAKQQELVQQELAKVRDELKTNVAENNEIRKQLDAVSMEKQALVRAKEDAVRAAEAAKQNADKQVSVFKEENKQLKADLAKTQENYERELQLHAEEVSRAATFRREMEAKLRESKQFDLRLEDLQTKLELNEQQAKEDQSRLEKALEEAVQAKKDFAQQNQLLHSQLEKVSTQLRQLHEKEMLAKVGEKSASISGEGDGDAVASESLVSAHDKEMDDLRGVVAFLRRESEISTSKLEVAQQETQRYRAQVFTLESTISRLREEMKVLGDNKAPSSSTSTGGSAGDGSKRLAQLEQLNLLRESNAALRDENQRNLQRVKELETKIRSLELQVEPFKREQFLLQQELEISKQEVKTLQDSNQRWKVRVDQLVEKYQQIDPAEHDRVCQERDDLDKKLKELQDQVEKLQHENEALKGAEGKANENWRKQYDRIKGFAKTWKQKAEGFNKQLLEKTKETETLKAQITTLENKSSQAQEEHLKVLAQKEGLEARMGTMENAGTANAAHEKEKQELKERLDAEVKEKNEMKERWDAEKKRSSQLKEFNNRLMNGLKAVKKENQELKDAASSASTTSATEATQPSADSVSSVTSTTQEATTSSTATATATPTPASETTPSPVVAVAVAAAKPEAQVAKPATSATPAAGAFAVASMARASSVEAPPKITEPIVSKAMDTDKAPASQAKPSLPGLSAAAKPFVPPAPSSAPGSASASPAAPPLPSPPAPAEAKESISAEEQLRLMVMRSLKQAKASTPVKATPPSTSTSSGAASTSISAPLASTALTTMTPATASATAAPIVAAATTEAAPKPTPFLNLTSPAPFGSGSASGLVFGKPGITLPIPSSPHPTSVGSTTSTATTTTAAPAPAGTEEQKRNQRLARFGLPLSGASSTSSSSTATPTAATIAIASTTSAAPPLPPANPLKRPASGEPEGPTKLAKVSTDAEEDESTTTPMISPTGSQTQEEEEEGEMMGEAEEQQASEDVDIVEIEEESKE